MLALAESLSVGSLLRLSIALAKHSQNRHTHTDACKHTCERDVHTNKRTQQVYCCCQPGSSFLFFKSSTRRAVNSVVINPSSSNNPASVKHTYNTHTSTSSFQMFILTIVQSVQIKIIVSRKINYTVSKYSRSRQNIREKVIKNK